MTDPRIQARRVRVERRARPPPPRRPARACWLAAGLSAGALALLHSSLFGARTVVIAGAVHTPRGEILAGQRPRSGASPHRRQPGTIMARRLDRLPWVADGLGARRLAVDRRRRRRRAGPGRDGAVLPAGGYAVFDSTGRVLADQATRPAGLPARRAPASSRRRRGARSAPRLDRCSRPPPQLPVSLAVAGAARSTPAADGRRAAA